MRTKPRDAFITAMTIAALVALVGSILTTSAVAQRRSHNPFTPTPGVSCGPGSKPEGQTQGRVPSKDHESGRAAKGYTCNSTQLAHFGETGGYRVHRYVDKKGHECAYYDTNLLFPLNSVASGGNESGVYVLDMSNPRKPKHTATLSTPAMQSPHESLSLNQNRGLLAAGMGYPTWQPGFVDIYSVKQNCRQPELMSSTPVGVLGHEGEFSPDGKTYWVSSPFTQNLTAIDVTDPRLPTPIATTFNWAFHGFNVSDDGTRMYGAETGSVHPNAQTGGESGLVILDVSDIQKRKPNPEFRFVSFLTWKNVSIPQTAIPITIGWGKYLVEVDEFGSGFAVGAGRIIDINNEKKPFVVSNLRLEVNNPGPQAGPQSNDPGASSSLQGYDAHYCAVPTRHDPGIVACSFIVSGLRVFDITDPHRPREIAYFNQPPEPNASGPRGSYAMSGPAFAAGRSEIWYSDGNSGFYNVRINSPVWPQRVPGPI
ncbi:MAG: LVIVD repeat-containing protein [Actinomycetota bacterium]